MPRHSSHALLTHVGRERNPLRNRGGHRRQEQPAPLVIAPGDQRRRDRRKTQCQPRQAVNHVRQHLAHDRITISAHRLDPKLAPAITPHQLHKPRPPLRAMTPDRVKLGRGVQPGVVRLQDPQQPVALEIPLGGDGRVVSDDRGSSAGSPSATRTPAPTARSSRSSRRRDGSRCSDSARGPLTGCSQKIVDR